MEIVKFKFDTPEKFRDFRNNKHQDPKKKNKKFIIFKFFSS